MHVACSAVAHAHAKKTPVVVYCIFLPMVLRWCALRARAPLSFYVTYVSLFSQIHFFGSGNYFLLTHLIDFEFCKIRTD